MKIPIKYNNQIILYQFSYHQIYIINIQIYRQTDRHTYTPSLSLTHTHTHSHTHTHTHPHTHTHTHTHAYIHTHIHTKEGERRESSLTSKRHRNTHCLLLWFPKDCMVDLSITRAPSSLQQPKCSASKHKDTNAGSVLLSNLVNYMWSCASDTQQEINHNRLHRYHHHHLLLLLLLLLWFNLMSCTLKHLYLHLLLAGAACGITGQCSWQTFRVQLYTRIHTEFCFKKKIAKQFIKLNEGLMCLQLTDIPFSINITPENYIRKMCL